MEKVYESEYWVGSYSQIEDLFQGVWLPASEQMTEDDLYSQLTDAFDQVKKYEPKLYLADDRKRLSVYVPDFQEWVGKKLGETFVEAGVGKLALLLPEDLFTEISTEQAVDEIQQAPFEIKNFSDKEEALAWLKS